MKLDKRINAFSKLGQQLPIAVRDPNHLLGHAAANAQHVNPWFTPENVLNAVDAIANEWLQPTELESWIKAYPEKYFNPPAAKTVGVVMAGNIPFVGFHDFLCALITGHKINVKLSSKDGDLMGAVAKILIEIEPAFADYIQIADGPIKGFDAVIATGSDSSVRYFDFYFRNYPSLIRGHRNGVALLTGNETSEELALLANDIFTYFGLGCRNVSKLLVPEGYNFNRLVDGMNSWKHLVNHHRYANNYEYNRTILIMNQSPHLDTGFVLIVPNENIDAPVATVNYQEYSGIHSAIDYINVNDSKVQCVATKTNIDHSRRVKFGDTQKPKLNDYSDGIDTIEFLGTLA
ncbi:MAG TPA: acyl-CoA reductase [Bacteroidales bacterium]|nr:acyl-CoA reductase [Bacteroidales bacterium]